MNEPVNISERRRPWKAPICDSSARGKGTTLKEQTGARTGKEKQTEPNTLSRKRPWAPAGRWSPHQARHSRARCPANLAAGLSGLSFGDRREKREERRGALAPAMYKMLSPPGCVSGYGSQSSRHPRRRWQAAATSGGSISLWYRCARSLSTLSRSAARCPIDLGVHPPSELAVGHGWRGAA